MAIKRFWTAAVLAADLLVGEKFWSADGAAAAGAAVAGAASLVVPLPPAARSG